MQPYGYNYSPVFGQKQWYVISPAIKSMRVPVLHDPTQSREVIGYLKANTIVEVISRSELWLCIQLTTKSRGYIQVIHTRPAAPWEFAVVTQTNTETSKVGASPLLTTQMGLTRGSKVAGPNLKPAIVFFTLACFTFGGAMFLSSITERACYEVYFVEGCSSNQPFSPIASVLTIVAAVLLALSVLIGIIALVSHSPK